VAAPLNGGKFGRLVFPARSGRVSGRQEQAASGLRLGTFGPRSTTSAIPGEFRGDDAVPSWSGFAVPPPEYVSGDADAVWRWGEGRGWPMIALWCELRRYDDLHSERKVHPVRGGIQTSLSDWGGGIAHNTDPRVLPLLPVWSGFAVDTVFYATVLGLFRAPFVVRRFLRRRRGRCPSCGYLASDSPVCTECGAVLGNRANP
jgi:hypothetical protein